MAEISGKKGLVEYAGGQVASVNSWSMDVNTDMLDITSFTTGTVQWRKFLDGLSGWSGTINAFFNAASTGLTDFRTNTLTPSTGQVILYLDKEGGENYRGSCFVSSLGNSVDIDGTANVTIGFQGTDTLTFSTAT